MCCNLAKFFDRTSLSAFSIKNQPLFYSTQKKRKKQPRKSSSIATYYMSRNTLSLTAFENLTLLRNIMTKNSLRNFSFSASQPLAPTISLAIGLPKKVTSVRNL
jgi:hypothetical protein